MKKRTIISIMIIGCLLATSIASVNVVSGKACRPFIYVDDDNTEGPWDGTKEHPYQDIFDGINAAEEGDTVFVFSGSYKGPGGYWVSVRKSIDLIGEDKYSTIIQEGFSVGDVSGINLSGFTIRKFISIWDCNNSIISNNIIESLSFDFAFTGCFNNIIERNTFYGGRGLLSLWVSDYNVVSNNIFSGFGIELRHSDHNTIINNNFDPGNIILAGAHNTKVIDNVITNIVSSHPWDISGYAIYSYWGSNHLVISGNKISNITDTMSADGIEIMGTVSYPIHNITVSNNTITNISGGLGSTGIWLTGEYTNSVKIIGNNISNIQGGLAASGIEISGSRPHDITVTGNTISDINGDESGIGITLKGQSGGKAYDNLINGNTITNCSYSCIYLLETKSNTITENILTGMWPNDNNFGICLGGMVKNTKISKNIIANNSRGLYLSIGCTDNKVSRNTFNNNAEGICMGRGENPIGYASRNKIIANNIENTTNYGIYCEDGSKNNEIHHNNLINNGKHAYDVGVGNNWDDGTEGNYWDDYEGVDEDPEDGIGDTPYVIDGKIFPSKDHFPFMEPVDIENIAINFEMTGEESSQSQQSTRQSYPSSQQFTTTTTTSTSTSTSTTMTTTSQSSSSSQPTRR